MGKLAKVIVHPCVPRTEEQEPELGIGQTGGLPWMWKLIFPLWGCSHMLIYDVCNATSFLGAKDFTIVILRQVRGHE